MDRKACEKLTPDEPSTPVMASHHLPISFAAWDIVMVGDVTEQSRSLVMWLAKLHVPPFTIHVKLCRSTKYVQTEQNTARQLKKIVSTYLSSAMVSYYRNGAILMLVIHHCRAFHQNLRRPLRSLSFSVQSTKSPLDPVIAAQFTIQVCTSTSCTRKLNEAGLDQYHVLGEIYARAQSANLEKCMIIEDGGCQGGKNCKMGEYSWMIYLECATIFLRYLLTLTHALTSSPQCPISQ